MFRTGFLSTIRSLALYTQQNLYDIYLLLCIQYLTPNDGQKTCPKHAEFYSKNKFEKLVHLVGFIIRIYHNAWSSECQMALVFAQGLMGWYMVQSGLEDRFHSESDVPRVSQYRLAAHLSLAFVLYTLLLWSAFDHLLPAQKLAEAVTSSARKFRWLTHTCKGMVFLTAVSGKYLIFMSVGCILWS